MMIGRGVAMLCLTVALTAQAAEKYHIFTDTQGRSIEAQLVSYDEKYKKVTLTPKGRAAMTVPLSTFSAEDQAYIVEWSHNRAFLNEKKLTLDFKRIKKNNTEKKRDSGYASNMEFKYYDHCFEIEIENKSKVDLKDIEFEYVVFYEQEHHINSNQDKVLKDGTLYGKQTVSVAKKSKTRITTDIISLKRYRESGYNLVWPDLDGEVHGIIVKMSMTTEDGERLVRQQAFPDRFDKAWTSKTKDAQNG